MGGIAVTSRSPRLIIAKDLLTNTSRVKDDLSVGVDTVLCAMVLTIANRSRSKSLR